MNQVLTQFVHCSLPEEGNPQQDAQVRYDLDLLSLEKITWEHFLQKWPITSRFFARLSTTRDGNSIVHLAILANRGDLVELILNHEPHLKLRRNATGLTPLELARLLPRATIASFLHPSRAIMFCDQPNVTIEDQEFFRTKHDLCYLAQPLFESEKVFEEVVARTQKAKREDAIPTERIWMGVYFDHELQTGVHPKISIQFIDEEIGFGAFAKQKIPPCAFVGEYTGVLQETKKKNIKLKFHCVRYTIWETGKKRFVIDAEKMGNFTRFINHSAKPNLGLQSVYWRGIPRMVFVSLREIPEGTQLTFDYGSCFWKTHPQTPKLFL